MTTPIVFQPGFRLIDGAALNSILGNPRLSYKGPLTATPAGTVANSLPITEAINQVDTVTSVNDGILLPPAVPGQSICIINNSSNALKAFSLSTINNTAGATGLAQNGNTVAEYFCVVAGKWFRQLSA